MSSFQLTGKIKTIGAIEQKSDKFRVRTFVLTIDGDTNYPQHIQLQASNDKCDLLNSFTNGSEVSVSFNLRGREWVSPQGEVKVFNSLEAWKIEALSSENSMQENQASITPQNQIPVNIDGGDDLPF